MMKNKWELTACGQYVKLFIKDDFYTLIDFSTLDRLIELNKTWGLSSTGGGRKYIHAFIEGRKRTLHRFLMDYPDKKVVDHINHNTFDNRLENLRVVTQVENQQNRGKLRKDNTTGVTGVSYDKKVKKFKAQVWVNGRNKWVGQFNTIEEADEAMRNARDRHYGGMGNGVL
jgi:hypothetical protein